MTNRQSEIKRHEAECGDSTAERQQDCCNQGQNEYSENPNVNAEKNLCIPVQTSSASTSDSVLENGSLRAIPSELRSKTSLSLEDTRDGGMNIGI